jgi:hypothetical protein
MSRDVLQAYVRDADLFRDHAMPGCYKYQHEVFSNFMSTYANFVMSRC